MTLLRQWAADTADETQEWDGEITSWFDLHDFQVSVTFREDRSPTVNVLAFDVDETQMDIPGIQTVDRLVHLLRGLGWNG